VRRVVVDKDNIRRGRPAYGTRSETVELRMKLPRDLVDRLDMMVKHYHTSRAALTRRYIREGLGLKLR
jgi:metal-responsive CopG/Arc/MetJ family transcriptional regulator